MFEHSPDEDFSEYFSAASFDTPSTLFDRAQQGDPDAVGTLCQLYTPWLYVTLRGWKVQPQDAADVTQDVLLIVSQNLADVDRKSEGKQFRAWLYVVMRNAMLQVLRRRRTLTKNFGDQLPDWILNDQPMPESDEDDEVKQHSQLLDVVLTIAIPAVQSEVEPETWETFKRMVFDCLTEREAAEEAGITPNAARARKHRILKKLRQKCQELLSE